MCLLCSHNANAWIQKKIFLIFGRLNENLHLCTCKQICFCAPRLAAVPLRNQPDFIIDMICVIYRFHFMERDIYSYITCTLFEQVNVDLYIYFVCCDWGCCGSVVHNLICGSVIIITIFFHLELFKTKQWMSSRHTHIHKKILNNLFFSSSHFMLLSVIHSGFDTDNLSLSK